MKILLSLIATLMITPALAADDTMNVALAKWSKQGDLVALEIMVEGQISRKQRNIIEGGFTTLSQLNVKSFLTGVDTDDLPAIAQVSCSVKYDAWEEVFDLAQISDQPTTALVKTFEDYANECLRITILDAEVLKRLAPQGGTLVANLIVKQTSVKEADEIKSQLIQNQSGIMQQLFAHMLGELVLSQTKLVRISVPPHPKGVDLKFQKVENPRQDEKG